MSDTTHTERVSAEAHSQAPSHLQMISVVLILGIGIIATAKTSDVNQASEAGIKLVEGRPFLAAHVGDWTGGPAEGLTEAERKILPPDTEGVRRIYTDSAGRQIYCSIVLAGKDVTSIHRPELCLTAQDWIIQGVRTEAIRAGGAPGGVLNVMRVNAKRRVPQADGGIGFANSIFLYWFVGKHRVTHHHHQRIFWTAKDRVLHNTNHRWAYILIHVPVSLDWDGEDIGQSETRAMKLVSTFVWEVYPSLVAD